ncbi:MULTISPECIES: TCR/Tet family MFS transporter [unclassified Janthinobacterium]|uniref:TCR/Tet family MFS transporter n=1 Tax=unclassified Janthinobacterium TaxID=2610881 RepID=UPI001610F403|nr:MULTISPECIES: TCR/Tet family MFS transporter [unclassified Janthinobacterium]MBB5366930.1 DHA1 family tetracycline resistance protein-like MFS transporter [Janthinobacterium sp. K2C7]MBB5380592.1 DHA1 family tetracycline resistance protein-like MFS transporter [Janthinobacterium sp. K2Li3]MBB5385312.1 DHA1 family tetracycline resistance protein-like MFS transporter [Janthinobacterium sp. K2E3]
MNKPLLIIFATIALDAAGIGLIFPILPRLLAEVTHAGNIAPYIGIMTALYATMQFICAPVLGLLSDKLGRRPVLLISLAGAAVNYVLMAFAPQLWMLLLGRAIAGLTSANVSVATAYITDISPEETRARRFGLLNAVFGLGFIVGPVLGGVLGDYWLRLPFIAAAVLNAANFLLALFVLPESRTPQKQKIVLAELNPLRPLRWAFSMKALLPIICVFFILSATGEVYGTCWALWGHDSFGWNGLWIGLSLGMFGVCQTLVQAFLPGPATRLLGERGAVLLGVGCASIALVVMAFAREGWIIFAIMPIFALGGIGVPALQALATRQVEEDRQGQFQGLLASVVSLASIIAPLAFSSFYFVVRQTWPGAIWLSVVVLNVIALPLIVLGTRNAGRDAKADESLLRGG